MINETHFMYMSVKTKQLLQDFLSTLKKEHTQKNYLHAIKDISNTFKKDFLDLSRQEITAYFSNLELSGSSLSVHFYCCHSFSVYLQEYLDDYTSPFLGLSFGTDATEYTKDDFPSLEELDNLLSNAVYGSDLYLAIVLALRMCLSLTEIVSLVPSQFKADIAGRFFLSLNRKSDTDMSVTPIILAVPDDIIPLITGRDRREYLFINKRGNPMNTRTFQRHLKATGTKWTFQSLRSFGIFLLLEGGADEFEAASFSGVTGRWLFRYRKLLKEGDFLNCAHYSNLQIKPPTDTI